MNFDTLFRQWDNSTDPNPAPAPSPDPGPTPTPTPPPPSNGSFTQQLNTLIQQCVKAEATLVANLGAASVALYKYTVARTPNAKKAAWDAYQAAYDNVMVSSEKVLETRRNLNYFLLQQTMLGVSKYKSQNPFKLPSNSTLHFTFPMSFRELMNEVVKDVADILQGKTPGSGPAEGSPSMANPSASIASSGVYPSISPVCNTGPYIAAVMVPLAKCKEVPPGVKAEVKT